MSWQLGTDPEFMIFNASNKPVPAHKFFPPKEDRMHIGGGQAFRDGWAVEINTFPQHCRETLAYNMGCVIHAVKSKLPEGYRLSSVPAVRIQIPKDLIGQPEDCAVFGCDPSWDAYTGKQTRMSVDANTHEWRYAGGHMHISLPNYFKSSNSVYKNFQWMFRDKDCFLFVKMLDLYVANPLSLLYNRPETFIRRRFYGRAGEFRFQTYGDQYRGVEYRTPGPEIWNSVPVSSFAFGAMRTVADHFEELKKTWDATMEPRIQEAVNTGRGARDLLTSLYGFYTKGEVTDFVINHRPYQSFKFPFQSIDRASVEGWNWYRGTRPEPQEEPRELARVAQTK